MILIDAGMHKHAKICKPPVLIRKRLRPLLLDRTIYESLLAISRETSQNCLGLGNYSFKTTDELFRCELLVIINRDTVFTLSLLIS